MSALSSSRAVTGLSRSGRGRNERWISAALASSSLCRRLSMICSAKRWNVLAKVTSCGEGCTSSSRMRESNSRRSKRRERVAVKAQRAVHPVELHAQLADHREQEVRGNAANLDQLVAGQPAHGDRRLGFDRRRARKGREGAELADQPRRLQRCGVARARTQTRQTPRLHPQRGNRQTRCARPA